MDHLQDMLPPEIIQANPGAIMLITFMREAKKDVKRMPIEIVEKLSRVVGEAFTWIADGSIEEPPGFPEEVEELLSTVG